MDSRPILAFICTSCKKTIEIGKCGEHRIKTGHKEYAAVCNKSKARRDKP